MSEWSIHVPGESEVKRKVRKEEEKEEGKGEGKKAERSKGVRKRGRRKGEEKEKGWNERKTGECSIDKLASTVSLHTKLSA